MSQWYTRRGQLNVIVHVQVENIVTFLPTRHCIGVTSQMLVGNVKQQTDGQTF